MWFFYAKLSYVYNFYIFSIHFQYSKPCRVLGTIRAMYSITVRRLEGNVCEFCVPTTWVRYIYRLLGHISFLAPKVGKVVVLRHLQFLQMYLRNLEWNLNFLSVCSSVSSVIFWLFATAESDVKIPKVLWNV